MSNGKHKALLDELHKYILKTKKLLDNIVCKIE